ncbi:MAG: GNAT family N-acetyltransferase [Gammaproteobacteria bacterium]|nr:MAG: GNAT family N-acetyltransferase [Gammaproteobacteria bacterium]
MKQTTQNKLKVNNLQIETLDSSHFEDVIQLGNTVHGDGYLDLDAIQSVLNKSIKGNLNCSFVIYDNKKLVGFRLTFAPEKWDIDKWCTPDLWGIAINEVCYFKCNTVDENYRGQKVGRKLLEASIDVAKKMGAKAGVCHTWMQSPGNIAYHYFIGCGGEFVKKHPNRWFEDGQNGYNCILCGYDCHCDALEMILKFK